MKNSKLETAALPRNLLADLMLAGLPVRLAFAAAAMLLALLAIPHAVHAQGIVRGAQEGSYEGNRIAGPVGGVVGGAVGAGVGGAMGAVKGVFEFPTAATGAAIAAMATIIGMGISGVTVDLRHCERSEAIHGAA